MAPFTPVPEEQLLAPYAMSAGRSRGRRYPEPEHSYRSPFQRDRDRIIHSRAFRRLEYKTQVFVNHEGDHYRTRLTHSLEVSQIARTVARALGLNFDLAESLALSHDLGHTPFGHLGEEVLRELMDGKGGFNHNRQSLRIVELLEERYPDFPGLNLTYEAREGIVKHSSNFDPEKEPFLAEYHAEESPPLEAQLIDLADEIAYNHHDIDDGLESRLLDMEGLVADVPLFGEAFREAERRHPGVDRHQLINAALRRLIDRLVSDLPVSSKTCAAVPSGWRASPKMWPPRTASSRGTCTSASTTTRASNGCATSTGGSSSLCSSGTWTIRGCFPRPFASAIPARRRRGSWPTTLPE